MTTFLLTHEANNLNEYTAQTISGGGSISTSAASAMGGTNYGLQSTTTGLGANAISYLDFASFGGTQYTLSFWFDPNSITMPTVNPTNWASADLTMVRLRQGSGDSMLLAEMQYNGTNYVIRAQIRDDSGALRVSDTITISNAAQFIEFIVTRATTVSTNDGILEIKIDDVSKYTRSDLDLFTRFTDPSRVELGIDDSEAGISGTCYWDQAQGLFGETASSGARPLEIDMDLAGGSKKWVTYWGAGTLNLRDYSDDFTVQNTTVFATGTTAAEIANRTYYLTPYAPPFFGTASLEDIVYVFGRWDDGSVRHLQKSTDGGASFSDIGDSATWGAGWVGGFFAQDANTLYAFVNGGSRALYRTTDGGSIWTSLSSLPFDVEPGGVSVHPDGRILIINRDASPTMAAYAVAPDYASWVDATGSPAFPQAGGGSNAVIWIT